MRNCKECEHNKNYEEKIDQSEKLKNCKKGFQIIVKSLDNGEILLDKKTKCIIGSIALEEVGENQGLIMANCNTPTLIATIGSADKTILEAKKRVVNDSNFDDFLGSLLKKLF